MNIEKKLAYVGKALCIVIDEFWNTAENAYEIQFTTDILNAKDIATKPMCKIAYDILDNRLECCGEYVRVLYEERMDVVCFYETTIAKLRTEYSRHTGDPNIHYFYTWCINSGNHDYRQFAINCMHIFDDYDTFAEPNTTKELFDFFEDYFLEDWKLDGEFKESNKEWEEYKKRKSPLA